jgi:hypothetical protein
LDVSTSFYFTALPPILTICKYTLRLNNVAGTYLRSLCFVEQSIKYAAAEATCSTNRMILFAIEGKEIYDAWVLAMGPFHTANYFFTPSLQFWVNGKKTAPSTWKIYNPNETPLYSGVTWNLNNADAGNRLRGIKASGGTQVLSGGIDGFDDSWFICEYRQP